ncbi:MAG: PadR family transcriptional regulator [Clostridiaceae bacterium]|nr:PadR family transcriptional regulator [Clostridiaceae bacterium]
MSAIDLAILGMVLEKPQSAYDLQKDVDYHQFPRWTKISTPSIYRKVIQLRKEGYLHCDIVKGDRLADKAVYSITEKGRAYFEELMNTYVNQPISFLFDFNVVITNLNKIDKKHALDLVNKLRSNIIASAKTNDEYAAKYADIPLVGRTIFEQQRMLYRALLEWLDLFEIQFKEDGHYGNKM